MARKRKAKIMQKILKVQYFTQLDNYGQEDRTCNSSACWGGAIYMKSSLLANAGFDDNSDWSFYLPRVEDIGDTTDHNAQTEALRKLGVESTWRTNLTIEAVTAEIDQGRPVVIGFLHKGPSDAPFGFGHIILVIGYEKDSNSAVIALIVNDSYGECNLVDGGYKGMPECGAGLRYSVKNMRPRFECDDAGYPAPGCGYGRIFAPNK